MKKFQLLVLLLFTSISLFAQDIIIKKSGEEINSKVLEVNLSIIKYKKFENLTGPTYEILKTDVFMIKYENGTKDIITPIEGKSQVKANSSPSIKSASASYPENLSFTSSHKSATISYGVSALLGYGAFSKDADGGEEKSYTVGPVSLSFNKALSDKFSIHYGPSLMYYHYGYSYRYGYYGSSYSGSVDVLFAGATVGANFHFATTGKLDPYVGAGGGVGYYYGIGGGDANGFSLGGSIPLLYGAKVGLNAYGRSKNAWTIELGYDYLSYLKVGYTFVKRK